MIERRLGGRRDEDASKRETLAAARLLTRWSLRLVVAYLVLLTSAIIGMFVLQQDTSRLAEHTREADLRSCHRLNLVRAGDNVSHFVEWTILSKVREQPLRQLALRLTWIPLTRSCTLAVDEADSFHAPNQVYFFQALPTGRDLQVRPGE